MTQKKKWDVILPVASPTPISPTFHFTEKFTLDLTDRTKVTGRDNTVSDFKDTQNDAVSILTGITNNPATFLPVASPAPISSLSSAVQIAEQFTLDLTDTEKVTGRDNTVSDFNNTQNDAILALTGLAESLGISVSEGTTIDEIFSELFAQHGNLLTKKIEKAEIFKKLFDPEYVDQRHESDSNPDHIESALLRKLAKEYQKYIRARENEILEDEIYQEQLRRYNDDLYEKAIAKKKRIANKKKLEAQLKGAFLSLMLGGDDQDIDVPVLVPLAPQLPIFGAIPAAPIRKVEAIEPIAPIKWSNVSFNKVRSQMEEFDNDLKDFREHIYAGIYRAWIDQNVILHCPERSRGPPALKLIKS